MSEHVVVKMAGVESISDIQNYLASFNKEIQGGGQVDAGGTVVQGTSSGNGEGGVSGETETYYVTESSENDDGTFQATFVRGENAETTTATAAQYNGGETTTFYHQTGTSFYTTEQPDTGGRGAAVDRKVLTGTRGGRSPGNRRQLVLASNNSQEETEATEISVTIPAALASSGTEELLQAVEAQEGSYVTMQTSKSGRQTIRMVVQQPDGTERHEDLEVPTVDGESSDGISQEISPGALQMMASLASGGGGEGGEGQPMVLNSGNGFQTVTLVPSGNSTGEVSYVLIVSQPDNEQEKELGGAEKGNEVDVDMSVYDFNESEQVGGGGGTQVKGDRGHVVSNRTHDSSSSIRATSTPKTPRVVKITTKKSQSVTQAHMCNYCNYTSPKRYLLSRHMKSHSEERPHKCSVCERGFKTLASLQNHVNTHTGTRPHQCKTCESAFTTSGELVRHVRYRHTHEKPHRCTDCDYASVELSKLKRHMRCHTGERPYQCPHCTYASPDTYKLKRHLRIHTGEKPYECDICHARFTQSNSLKAHKLIHTGQKPVFQCELCPTTCGRKTDLRIHVQKLHTSERPLKCRRCGKSFPDRYTYKMHTKTHDGEKCFKCDLCPYASISQRHLESHMLIHTDQKPYQCDKCEQAFRQKQLLKRHRNLYHDPNYVPPTPKEKTHQCAECMRAFRHKGNLIRHMAIHDPDATAQEKEAAMQVIKTIKRINENGEEEEFTEEEDDFDDDEFDDDDDLDDNQLSVGRQITTADGQQVVVLEVIQLQGPEGEQQAVALYSGDGVEMVDETGLVRGSTVVQADGDTSTIEGLGEALNQLGGTHFIMETSAPKKKKKRNKAKYQLVTNDFVRELEEGGILSSSGRPTRVKRRKTEDSDYIYMTPTKKVRRSSSSHSTAQPVKKIKKVLEPAVPSEEELARREAEAENKRRAQKQKDIEECFGFKDDGDEDEDEEEMDEGHSSVTETAVRLLAAMQGSTPHHM